MGVAQVAGVQLGVCVRVGKGVEVGQTPVLQPGVDVAVGVLQFAGLQPGVRVGVTQLGELQGVGVAVGQAPALQLLGVLVAAAVGCGVAVICGRG